MTTLVTGSHGFIGSRLAKGLENTIRPHYSKLKDADIGSVTRVYWLSAYGNLHSQLDFDATVKAQVKDLLWLITNLNPKAIRWFCYFSSSSVLLQNQTAYSRTKAAAEDILLAWSQQYAVPLCIVRPFSVTGVGEQKEHLVPALIDSCLNGTRISFVPWPAHDFIDVEDVVSDVMELSDKLAMGIYELGNGYDYTNQKILEMVEEVTKKKANVQLAPHMMRPYDVHYGWRSTKPYKGSKPHKALVQTLQQMVEVERERA